MNNFEQYINEIIVSRGEDYYEWELVNNINEIQPGHFHAIVNGSEDYHVQVTLDEPGNILYSSCDCPYDFGDICKHETAVFFALRNRNSDVDREEPTLHELLQTLTKKELMQLLVEYATDNPVMEQELRLKYGPKKNGIAGAKELIQQYIEMAEEGGFVNWRNASLAVKGAELVIEKMEESIANQETKIAVLLGELILTEMIDLLQYCDDSGGEVGMVVDEALDKIDTAILEGVDHLNDLEKIDIVQQLIDASRKNSYKGWSEWRFALLEFCVSFCDSIECRKMLEEELEQILAESNSDRWSASYDRKQIKLIQLELIEQFETAEKRNMFLEKNIDSSEFRERVIQDNFNQASYDKVIELCLDGEKKDKQSLGLVHKWQHYRFQAYKALQDETKQKSLGMSLLLEGNYDYFLILKQLYNQEEWSQVLEYITDNLSQTRLRGTIYVRILIEEGLTDKLLTYCENSPIEIEHLYPHLIEQYPQRVTEIFKQHIHSMAERSSNRSAYRNVCKVIKTFRKVCGPERANVIIKELEDRYPKKPAFLDELSKV